MNVTIEEGKRFYELYVGLLSFANRRLDVVSAQFSNVQEYVATPPEARFSIRDALFSKREIIDQFVDENPNSLLPEDLQIIAKWKHAIADRFIVFRYLKKHTIFLQIEGESMKVFGVLGLADPLERIIGPALPRLVSTVLLPLQGKIIYDGLMGTHDVNFVVNFKKTLNVKYSQAIKASGVITSFESEPQRSRKSTSVDVGRSQSVDANAIAESLSQMTDVFCRNFLSKEYAELCRKLAKTLARKRPSPLLTGRLPTWAAGIVRTIGWVNFLNDPSQKPYMKLSDIDSAFNVSESTGAASLKKIRDILRIRQFDPEWTLPSKMDDNPMIWLLEFNGLIVDIRQSPRELQEAAFRKNLIPYIPADGPSR